MTAKCNGEEKAGITWVGGLTRRKGKKTGGQQVAAGVAGTRLGVARHGSKAGSVYSDVGWEVPEPEPRVRTTT